MFCYIDSEITKRFFWRYVFIVNANTAAQKTWLTVQLTQGGEQELRIIDLLVKFSKLTSIYHSPIIVHSIFIISSFTSPVIHFDF